MTPTARLARVEALRDALLREHGVCDCARRLAEALGDESCGRCSDTGLVAVMDFVVHAGEISHAGRLTWRPCPACHGTGRGEGDA